MGMSDSPSVNQGSPGSAPCSTVTRAGGGGGDGDSGRGGVRGPVLRVGLVRQVSSERAESSSWVGGVFFPDLMALDSWVRLVSRMLSLSRAVF